MFAKKVFILSLAGLISIGLAFSVVWFALAQTVGAGTQSDPVVVDWMPFSNSADTSSASVGPNDPQPSCANGWPRSMTRWYAFTPAADMVTRASVSASYYNSMSMAAFTVDASSVLTEIACTTNVGDLVLSLTANQKVYFMIGGQAWNPGPYAPPSGWSVSFNLNQLLPPANDNFANAEVITALPFSVYPDLTYATSQPSEPDCYENNYPPFRTVWYRYTPTQTATLIISPIGNSYVGIYSGTELTSLSRVACANAFNTATISGQASTTYYIQLSGFNGWGSTGFTLEPAPAPYVSLYYAPGDPSIYDPAIISSSSWDPAGMDLSVAWLLGDGTTYQSQGQWATISHTYAADGDYTVTLTATASDGRSGSASVLIPVRTHDVAITDLKAPEQVKAGQKHRFVVTLANSRYPETVQVELYKNSPGGFTLFGILLQDVPVGKPTDFKFDYQFSQSDVDQGVNTFQAVANLVGNRDAVLTNNTLTIGTYKEKTPLKDWSVYSGVWSIVNGQLTTIADTGAENWIWAGNPAPTVQGDFTAGFTLKLSQGNDWAGSHGGVMFFSSVPTIRWDYNMTGYTLDWLSGDGLGIRLHRWDHGQEIFLFDSGMAHLANPPAQWLIQVQGDTIRFYGDGVLIVEIQDNTYRSGHFGFWAWGNGTKIEVSNVKIGSQFKALWK